MDRPSSRFFFQHERDPVLSIGSTKKVMNGVLDDEPMDEGDYEIGYGLYGGGGAGSGTAVEENGGGGSSPSLGKGGEAEIGGEGGDPVSMAVPSNPMNHLELDDYYDEEDGEEEGKEEVGVGGGGGEGSRGDDLEGLRYSASVYRLSRTGNRLRKGKGVGKLGEQTDTSFCHIFMVKRIFVTLFVPVPLPFFKQMRAAASRFSLPSWTGSPRKSRPGWTQRS